MARGKTTVARRRGAERASAMMDKDKRGTTFLISRRLPLEKALTGYKTFKEQQGSWPRRF